MQNDENHFKVGDVVWRRTGHFYQKCNITAMDGEKVTLGNKQASIDDLLPGSIFAVPDEIKGLAYETHIYDYLVFRTYASGRMMDMGAKGKPEGLYVEKPVCETYRRQHFPGHPAGRPDVLRLLAALEELAAVVFGRRADSKIVGSRLLRVEIAKQRWGSVRGRQIRQVHTGCRLADIGHHCGWPAVRGVSRCRSQQ